MSYSTGYPPIQTPSPNNKKSLSSSVSSTRYTDPVSVSWTNDFELSWVGDTNTIDGDLTTFTNLNALGGIGAVCYGHFIVDFGSIKTRTLAESHNSDLGIGSPLYSGMQVSTDNITYIPATGSPQSFRYALVPYKVTVYSGIPAQKVFEIYDLDDFSARAFTLGAPFTHVDNSGTTKVYSVPSGSQLEVDGYNGATYTGGVGDVTLFQFGWADDAIGTNFVDQVNILQFGAGSSGPETFDSVVIVPQNKFPYVKVNGVASTPPPDTMVLALTGIEA